MVLRLVSLFPDGVARLLKRNRQHEILVTFFVTFSYVMVISGEGSQTKCRLITQYTKSIIWILELLVTGSQIARLISLFYSSYFCSVCIYAKDCMMSIVWQYCHANIKR